MKIDPTVFLAKGCVLVGDITLEENVNVWYNAVVRGDNEPITVGRDTNIQDNAVLHVFEDYPLVIGSEVTIGHSAVVHGCTVGDNTIIGMGAIVMDGAKIGANCIVGAGALVTQGTEIPDGSLVMGSPAKVKRALTEEEIAENHDSAARYVREAVEYRKFDGAFIKE